MSNLNLVALQGNLVDDPKIMGEEKNVARFTIAVNNGFGENQSTTYVDCVAFGKQAGVIAEHIRKGKQIIVRGQLIQNRWEDKETGQKRSKLEVRLDNFNGFSFTGSGGGAAGVSEDEAGEEPVVEKASKGKAKAKAGAEGGGEGKLF